MKTSQPVAFFIDLPGHLPNKWSLFSCKMSVGRVRSKKKNPLQHYKGPGGSLIII